jgi:outer membrane protein OmpA-like peptidoglycan-associated protein/osmotically-inducible protein OsmY
MSKKLPFCCTTFPKGVWWLLTLLGAPLLFLFMVMSKQDEVEQDLQQRTTQQLTDKNINWTTVKLDKRGRDAVLHGNAPDIAAHDQALNLAQEVYGVRHVSNKMTINGADSDTTNNTASTGDAEPIGKPATFALTSNDEGIVLTGTMPNQKSIDTLVATTIKSYDGKQVTNQLTIEKGITEANWLPAVNTLIPTLVDLKQADLYVSDNKKSLSGKTTSATEKAAILSAMTTALGEEQTFTENIAIEVPRTEIATSSDSLLSKTIDPPTTTEMADTTETTKTEPETAVKTTEVESTTIETSKPDAIDSETTTAKTEEKREEPAVDACQEKLNTVMQNKKILFANNRAKIRSASFPLLNDIASIIKECKDVVSNKGISINGHTDSRGKDSYNQALSERRAQAVKSHLTKKGVSSALMKAKGYGETQPVADNKTDEGRAQNRRITFKIKS